MSSSGSIHTLLIESRIELDANYAGKDSLLNGLVDLVQDHDDVLDATQLREDILARENLQSTGVGYGIAIPHAKSKAVQGPVVSFVSLKDGIDFDSFDKLPVDTAFLIAGPQNAASLHIRLLSRLSRLLNIEELRKSLSTIDDPGEVISLLKKYETQIWGS